MGTEEDSSQVSLELERQTRSQRIDPKLKAAGWHVVPFVSGKPFADYGTKQPSPSSRLRLVRPTTLSGITAKLSAWWRPRKSGSAPRAY
jgi:hypothetical protein